MYCKTASHKHFFICFSDEKAAYFTQWQKNGVIFLIGLNLDAVLEEDAVAVLWGRGRPADQPAGQVQGHGVQVSGRR
jgi:hypothetical protein